MAKRRWQRGKFSERREPIWEPLLELLPEDIDDFMWMGETALTDGTQVQLYKHYWTRRYLAIDLGGRVFVNPGTDRWEEPEDADWILEAVVGFGRSRGEVFRRNKWIDAEKIGWTRSATKGGVARSRSLYVVRSAGICWCESEFPEESYGEPRFLFLGPDEKWTPLEVLAVLSEDGRLMVIHAKPLRARWQGWYEEAEKWRK